MTDTRIERLSRAIAKHFEPEPVCVSMDLFAASKEGWWVWKDRVGMTSTGYGHFVPRKITEPEISMKLLKELLARDPRTLIAICDRYDYFGRKEHDSTAPCSVIQGPELVQAIAEAFAKAVGLEVE